MESEQLIDNKTMSDFVGLVKDKWQNRNNNQTLSGETLPSSPKENIFQRIGRGIKETVDGFGDPKELREYKQMTRDMEQATRDMRANQVSFEDLLNLPLSNVVPLESFAPMQNDNFYLKDEADTKCYDLKQGLAREGVDETMIKDMIVLNPKITVLL